MDADVKKYLDRDAALGRLGGNVKLYVRLLRQFLDSDYCKELENAFLSGNEKEFKILAHSVKGVSSNLALMEIYSGCAKLESNVKNGVDNAEDLAAFKQIYKKTEQVVADFIAERNE